MNKDFIGWLGKEAAYRKALITPPKAGVSRSRTVKLRSKKDEQEAEKAATAPAGNSQPPYRYGRRVTK